MRRKHILSILLILCLSMALCACQATSYDKIVEKAFDAIAQSDFDKARAYFADSLSVMVGEETKTSCDNKNSVDNYVLDLISKGTTITSLTSTSITQDSAAFDLVITDKAMALSGIQEEHAQLTFYFTENKISRIVYANRDEYNQKYQQYQGAGGKFTAQIQSDGNFKVTNVTKGGPAAKAGLKAGDIITAIDTVSCTDMNSIVKEQSIRCRGEVGTQVTLTVLRTVNKEEQTLEITYTRVALEEQ